jgi:uncharacterized protein (TIGR02246 family)
MKRLATMLLGLGLLVAPSAWAGSHAADEDAIKALGSRFEAAWSAGDAQARASVWAKDGTLVSPFGVSAKGTEEIKKVFEQENQTIAKGTVHKFSNYSFRFLTGGKYAFADADITITGIKSPEGKDMPPAKGHVGFLCVKGKGSWHYLDARPAIFPPAPDKKD